MGKLYLCTNMCKDEDGSYSLSDEAGTALQESSCAACCRVSWEGESDFRDLKRCYVDAGYLGTVRYRIVSYEIVKLLNVHFSVPVRLILGIIDPDP
jgi:hypothetical protein